MYASDVDWPGPISEIQHALAGLQRYAVTPRTSLLFCGTCSAPLFWESVVPKDVSDEPDLFVFTSTLSVDGELSQSLVRITEHGFVGDTLDGGLATCLPPLRGDRGWFEAGRSGKSVKIDDDWAMAATDKASSAPVPDDIPIRCHCGGIDLVLRWALARRDFDDLVAKGQRLPWFVDPESHRLLANFDPCDSCRITSGAEIFTWTFTYLRHIGIVNGDGTVDDFPATTQELKQRVLDKDSKMGTLTMFASSPDVQRYSCSRCSAVVFYACDSRSDMVDVSIGIIDAGQLGSRVENVLLWNYGAKFVHRQCMTGTWREEMLLAAETGSEDWRLKREYPKSWIRVMREEASKTQV
jgi:hypothetical protein